MYNIPYYEARLLNEELFYVHNLLKETEKVFVFKVIIGTKLEFIKKS